MAKDESEMTLPERMAYQQGENETAIREYQHQRETIRKERVENVLLSAGLYVFEGNEVDGYGGHCPHCNEWQPATTLAEWAKVVTGLCPSCGRGWLASVLPV